MSDPAFTAEQIKHWRAYERVRQSGLFNMFDPRARKAARLTPEQYAFVMDNFEALQSVATARPTKP